MDNHRSCTAYLNYITSCRTRAASTPVLFFERKTMRNHELRSFGRYREEARICFTFQLLFAPIIHTHRLVPTTERGVNANYLTDQCYVYSNYLLGLHSTILSAIHLLLRANLVYLEDANILSVYEFSIFPIHIFYV